MSHPGSVCAGNATAVAASSRYAAPPLRSGPSGDTATAVAKWLIMTGRVLPVITDRHLTSAPTEDPTIPLTSSRAMGNVRSSRAKNQSEYTLSLPLDCPTNQDHLTNNKDNLSYVDGVELSDINSALVDPDIYTGNAIQNLLANTKALNTQLDALIQDERKQASASIETLEIKLFGYEQYQTLDPEKQEYLNTAITQAKEAIKSNSLVAMIRDRAHNFEEKQFPRLIDQLVAWSEPTSAVEPPVGHPYNGAGGEVDQPAVAPTPPRAATISARDISVSFEKPWLSDEADVDAYVERYKDALIDAVKNGKKVRV